jgi:anti-sigma factor RsiW
MITSKIKKNVSMNNISHRGNPNQCKRIRNWLYSALSRHVNPEAAWLQNHIANCPRCRKRFISHSRVNLALSFIKSQPLNLSLLRRANEQTINVLKHSLREVPKADKLRQIKPEPTLMEKWSRHIQPVGNLAACAAVLLLMKTGIFSSMDGFQTRGQKVIRQYYAKQVGEDLAEEIFPSDSIPSS